MMVDWSYDPSMISALTPVQDKELAPLDRTPNDPRLRTGAQMVFREAAQGRQVPQMACRVREREASRLRWFTRDRAVGMDDTLPPALDVLRR